MKKYCLDMRDNYNKSQTDDYPAGQCTKEKEALKHFNMK